MDFLNALKEEIEKELRAESDKLIERQVELYKGKLNDIRDDVIGKVMKNIRIMSENNVLEGKTDIHIHYHS